jgi:large subunit ribosomal protein L19e
MKLRELIRRTVKAGKKRIKIHDPNLKLVTKEDVRQAIKEGKIEIINKKGQYGHAATIRRIQKKKGRRRGHGKRKGKATARMSKKEKWMKTIRAIRRQLRKLRDAGVITKKEYRRMYMLAKGNYIKSKRGIYEVLELIRRGAL